jgi:hypothetical protein
MGRGAQARVDGGGHPLEHVAGRTRLAGTRPQDDVSDAAQVGPLQMVEHAHAGAEHAQVVDDRVAERVVRLQKGDRGRHAAFRLGRSPGAQPARRRRSHAAAPAGKSLQQRLGLVAGLQVLLFRVAAAHDAAAGGDVAEVRRDGEAADEDIEVGFVR